MGKGKRLRAARAANRMSPSTSMTPVGPADVELPADLFLDDPCTVPEGVEHCHGAEVEHSDGTTECDMGDQCEAPGELHTQGMNCTLVEEPDEVLRHRCSACR